MRHDALVFLHHWGWIPLVKAWRDPLAPTAAIHQPAQKDWPVVYRFCFVTFYFNVFCFSFSLLKMCLEFISAPFTVSRRGTLLLARQGIQLITHNVAGARGVSRNGCLRPLSLPWLIPQLMSFVQRERCSLDASASQRRSFFLRRWASLLLFCFVFLVSSPYNVPYFFTGTSRRTADGSDWQDCSGIIERDSWLILLRFKKRQRTRRKISTTKRGKPRLTPKDIFALVHFTELLAERKRLTEKKEFQKKKYQICLCHFFLCRD